jgi:hypothetical protein
MRTSEGPVNNITHDKEAVSTRQDIGIEGHKNQDSVTIKAA